MSTNISEILNLDFDETYNLGQVPSSVKLDTKGLKQKDVQINLDPKKGINIGDRDAEEEEQVDDATADYLKSVKGSGIGNIKAQPLLASRNKLDIFSSELPSIKNNTQVASIDNNAAFGMSSSNVNVDPDGFEEAFYDSGDLEFDSDSASYVEQGLNLAASDYGQNLLAKGADFFDISNKPVTEIGSYQLPGYSTQITKAPSSSFVGPMDAKKVANPGVATTATGQFAAGAAGILSAYSAYDALKGGIDSPMEAAQLASGVIGTVGALNTMGLMSTPGFMAAAGPVGWAIAGATLLYSTGLIGGKGKSKPPMGGVEVRLADESGKLYTSYEEGKNLKISAGSASSYNGFNSQAMKNQTQKNIDYMYAFADEFGLKVNEKAWAEAAFGPNKYMPRGREKPYRSALEKIDSMGDGSSSPSEWLRHAMEYQSESGERIIDGDIYKGVRIGPNGLPMKVGYKSQESFQEAVADFNKKFYG